MSIPKIIHYCWLSNDPIPESLQQYMSSWRKFLPDYQFMLWNFDRFDINSSVWVKEAFEAKKYAFAADYIRCFALYKYGGIYLDMDVEVLKPFDDLLDLPYFLCHEHNREPSIIEAAIMGAEKQFILFEKMLEYYAGKHFIQDNNYDTRTLPKIMQSVLLENFQIKQIKNINEFERSSNIASIFPSDRFSPKSYETGRIHQTENTYAIHHFAGSWLDDETLYIAKVRRQMTFLPRQWRGYIAKFIGICRFRGIALGCKELMEWAIKKTS